MEKIHRSRKPISKMILKTVWKMKHSEAEDYDKPHRSKLDVSKLSVQGTTDKLCAQSTGEDR